MFTLYVQAPFAAFRTFHTGSFRPTAPFMTPSAAYGLLLNLANIDMRLDDGKSAMTLIREELPAVTLAIGAVERCDESGNPCACLPDTATVFQQLHNYPVGASGAEHAPRTKGAKYNVTPVRREFLHGLKCLISVEADPDLEGRIERGLAGSLEGPRYGLPFLGDNAFLPDVISRATDPPAAYWFCRVNEAVEPEQLDHPARLTTWINRADSSKTVSHLFSLQAEPTRDPPDSARVTLPPR